MILPLVLLVLLGVDWATGYAIAGYVMRHGVSPYGYAFWQSVGPLLCLFVIQVWRSDFMFNRKVVTYSVGCGLFGIAIPNLLIYIASKYVNSGILTIIANTAPIFTYPMALYLHQEKFKLIRLVMVVLGAFGVLAIVFQPSHFYFLQFVNWGIGLALIIPLCYAFAAVYIARFRPHGGNILSHAFLMLIVSSAVLSPLTFIMHGFYSLHVDDTNSYLIISEILLSAFGYVLLFIIINMVGPVYYTLVNAVAAVTGLLYARLIFSQQISHAAFAGIGLILFAILGLSYTQQKVSAQK